MLSNKHIYEELQKIDEVIAKVKDDEAKALLKSNTIIIKLLHNIRTNLVSMMKKYDIPLIEGGKQTEDAPKI